MRRRQRSKTERFRAYLRRYETEPAMADVLDMTPDVYGRSRLRGEAYDI